MARVYFYPNRYGLGQAETLPDVSKADRKVETPRTDPTGELMKLYAAFIYNYQPPYALDFDRVGSVTGV